jgi:hypothetical protein
LSEIECGDILTPISKERFRDISSCFLWRVHDLAKLRALLHYRGSSEISDMFKMARVSLKYCHPSVCVCLVYVHAETDIAVCVTGHV